jgi:hypothetical protein
MEAEGEEESIIKHYQKPFLEIKRKYEEAYRILIQQLTTLFNTSNSNHINQLLLKLDFNHYYSDNKMSLGY